MRITKTGQKVAYILAFVTVSAIFNVLQRQQSLGFSIVSAISLVQVVWVCAGVFVGTRTFRGDNEAVAPARPWWRWTARPRAGAWLSVYFLLAATVGLVNLVTTIVRIPDAAAVLWRYELSVLTIALIGVGYLNSTIRLRRHPELLPPRPTKVTAPAPPPPADRVPEGW